MPLNYDDEEEFGDFENEDAYYCDESIDFALVESAAGGNMVIRTNFSLEYMKKAIDYYKAHYSKGRKNSHESLLNIASDLFLTDSKLLVFVTISNNIVLKGKSYKSSMTSSMESLRKLEKIVFCSW